MSSRNDHHYLAMNLVESAILERIRGNEERSRELYADALKLELEAIKELEVRQDRSEPSWSVLHRSAGWMAFNSNQYRQAEQLASQALAGEPHPTIADELRDLWEHANFHRHLEPQGIALADDEVQLSLVGNAVASGFTLWADFASRVNSFQTLVHRIVQRGHKHPYQGSIPSEIRTAYPTFTSAPSSGSFVVSLKLGHPSRQLPLPVPSDVHKVEPHQIINELIDLMALVNTSQIGEIQRLIPDAAYQRNFLGLAKKLAPDGDKIRQVGFTSGRGDKVRSVSMTTTAAQMRSLSVEVKPQDGASVEVSGILRYADAGTSKRSRNRIRLVDLQGASHEVIVPEGMMDDIVRPMWSSFVTVKGSRWKKQKVIRLTDIWEGEPTSVSETSASRGPTSNSIDQDRLPLL